jgi:hypothetical protein
LTQRGRALARWGLALVGFVGLVALLPRLSATIRPGADSPAGSQAGAVLDIRSIADLRQGLNQDRGQVRVVLLLSPT